LQTTERAVQSDPKAAEIVQFARALVRRLRRQWLPASELPIQLVHGDFRLGNVCRSEGGRTVYLDFGFFARRPRIHELAYALAFMLLALDAPQAPESFCWACIPGLIAEYEAGANVHLAQSEQRALAPYTASIPLYFAAFAGFTKDPVAELCSSLSFLQLSEWLLAHPAFLPGSG
jgi:aminoglycoside phosphotransferase (APT) family kinase protein